MEEEVARLTVAGSKEKRRKKPVCQRPLHGLAPGGLTSFHQDPSITGPISSQGHHQLATKPWTHGPLGDICKLQQVARFTLKN
jgi:hypothetical protein